MNDYYIAIGSNSGDREAYLHFAREEMKQASCKIVKSSLQYETEPWGFLSNQWFYNQVIQVECHLEPLSMLEIMQAIEKKAGRVRLTAGGYVSRTLDLDILFHGNSIFTSDILVIPHPFIQERRFVLEPLCEIAPDLIHPVLKQTLSELLEKCMDRGEVRKVKM